MFAGQPTEMTLKCVNAFQNDIPSCPGCILSVAGVFAWAMRWAHAAAADRTLTENTSYFNPEAVRWKSMLDSVR